jgi:hypothetical protein
MKVGLSPILKHVISGSLGTFDLGCDDAHDHVGAMLMIGSAGDYNCWPTIYPLCTWKIDRHNVPRLRLAHGCYPAVLSV